MRQALFALAVAMMAALLPTGPGLAAGRQNSDFVLGKNAEGEVCRAVARFDVPRGVRAVDIYCGAWERPSGRVTAFETEAQAHDALSAVCPGDEKVLESADLGQLRQIACARRGDSGPRRYGLVARKGQSVIVGEVYPSDWSPMVAVARVFAGAAPVTVANGDSVGAAGTPGLREIQAVFPAGPPGQSASVNYELLRRRAFEYNMIWSFSTAQRDFEELLRLHKQVAPDDVDGEAEILAEIGLNMSGSRRFDEASQTLDQAQGDARTAGDTLLATKIVNYRAIDQLNQRHFGAAMRLALQANEMRAALAREARGAAGTHIGATDVAHVERHSARISERSLLVSLTDAPVVDRATVLSAQGYYIAAVAARGLGRADATALLDAAASLIEQVNGPPAWLVGDITNERAEARSAAGDFAEAVSAAKSGLATIKTVAPQTRAEAHLWLTLESAQKGMGRLDEAVQSGRAALAIYARQTESPGLPPDVAAIHLSVLELEWRRTGDPRLAEEYFQTLSLVWDGAAAQTTAQLAARMALREVGPQARAYQDAERTYRAALARRQILSGDPEANPGQIALADKAVRDMATRLAGAEDALRERAPAYLELLSPKASAPDLEAALGQHEAYLRVVVGSRGGFAALVDKSGVHPFTLTLAQDQVDALVDRLRRSTQLKRRRLPDFDIEASGVLYKALIAPVADQLRDVTSLDLDVSGSLASAPFAALLESPPNADQLKKIHDSQDYTGLAWLGRRMTLSYTLGPASFTRLRKEASAPPARLRATIYGDYEPNPHESALRLAEARGLSNACRDQVERGLAAMGPLPDTADEARGVAAKFQGARLVLGGDFTDADFMSNPDTGSADVILLATHGVLAMSSCLPEPALLTSVGNTGSGLIEASQLFDRQLKARLVVLSACDTAAGGKLDESITGLADGGDALSGLARGFIYAGARDVLATQWKVDAVSSGAEMTAFFDRASRPGVSLGEALSVSQKALYDDPETAHPFYWAGFVLMGNWL